jgi:hypothetical protein
MQRKPLLYLLFFSLLFSLANPALSLAQEPITVQSPPTLGGCQIFPANNIWNTPIDTLPVDPNSNTYINAIGAGTRLHADFGAGLWEGAPIGIPFEVVPPDQELVDITSFLYDDESDPGPYPIPPNAEIEGGPGSDGDRHVLVLHQGECKLYELYRAFPNGDDTWYADSGAVFDLNSHALRPATWTSADAAGLPILPGLARYEEVLAGEINHALRFTSNNSKAAYVWPARHQAPYNTQPGSPPMGQYFRLKASFVIDNSFSSQGQVLLRAMKKYGLILADNGSSWYISGAPNPFWDNDAIADDFRRVRGSDFEAVDVSSLQISANSGQASGFNFVVTPPTQAIEAGQSASYRIEVTISDNFTGTVTLSSANSSPGLIQNLSPTSLTASGVATLTLTDTHPNGPLLPGLWHTRLIVASDGSQSRSSSIKLLVGGARTYLPVVMKP